MRCRELREVTLVGLLLGAAAFTPVPLSAAERGLRAAHAGPLPEVLQDLFRPVTSESPPAAAHLLHGALPPDLPRGAVLKNGPNPVPERDGSGGWLDGDGMVHACVLPPDGEGPPRHSRTWLRTAGFAKEAAAGARLFDGSLVAPDGVRLLWNLLLNAVRAGQPQKDTANTAFLELRDGRCLALMEQCLPCEFRVSREAAVSTLKAEQDLDGALRDSKHFPFSGGALTAHLKTDPASGESIGVTYVSSGGPAAKVTTFGADGRLRRGCSLVRLPGGAQPMIHDCAITQPSAASSGHVLLLDFSLTIRPIRMLRDDFPVEFEPAAGSRIGLLPRASLERAGAAAGGGALADASDGCVWFDVEPCAVLHTVNAHEADGKVVLTALRSEPRSPESFIQSYTTALLHRWVLDPASGRVEEEALNTALPIEFPTLDPRAVGRPVACAYAIRPCTIGGPNRHGPPFEGILINGVVRYEVETGRLLGEWVAPEGWWVVSEAKVVPKLGSELGGGENVYLLVFCSRAAVPHKVGAAAAPEGEEVGEPGDGRASRLYVLDAARLDGTGADPVAAVVSLPAAVPYGLHSAWLPYEELPP